MGARHRKIFCYFRVLCYFPKVSVKPYRIYLIKKPKQKTYCSFPQFSLDFLIKLFIMKRKTCIQISNFTRNFSLTKLILVFCTHFFINTLLKPETRSFLNFRNSTFVYSFLLFLLLLLQNKQKMNLEKMKTNLRVPNSMDRILFPS